MAKNPCDALPPIALISELCLIVSVLFPPPGYSPICPPCDNEMKTDAILEHMCASEFGKQPLSTHNTDSRIRSIKSKELIASALSSIFKLQSASFLNKLCSFCRFPPHHAQCTGHTWSYLAIRFIVQFYLLVRYTIPVWSGGA